jgi:protoheme IX farnesyltransferase
MPFLRRLALFAAIATYLLIVVGAIVRTTGSGLGCPDWPLCHGQVVPPPDVAAWVEFSHRLLGAFVSALILAVCGVAWMVGRGRRSVLVPATLIPPLLLIQIVLGGVVVLLELPALVVMVHLGFALVILALLIWVCIASRPPLGATRVGAGDTFEKLTLLGVGLTFGLIMLGAWMRSVGAGWACVGFPECNGRALPFGTSGLVDIHLTHRVVAYGLFALSIVIARRAFRDRADVPGIGWVAVSVVGMIVLQITIGAIAVIDGPGWDVQTAHVAGASAVWSMMVVLAALTWRSRRGPLPESVESTMGKQSARELATAYFMLTKPRVMVLLLLTTLAAMLMVDRGMPSFGILFFTMLGGALATGGAGAINHYLDRDIDVKMSRTSARPVARGMVSPRGALIFGIVLGVFSFVLMVAFVNLLAAALTMLALLFYVFVYTGWLKRTTPQNIVIGGAAGAIPPVVGIAAVTGHIDLLAVLLFTIIFVWTPPHFWALALIIRPEYEAAGVPMLPVVKGDEATRRQILWYSIAMVVLTLSVSWLGLLGAVYLISAAVLGGLFVYLAVKLLRQADLASARTLFRYSILYLALLFVAMVVDRQVAL